MPAKALKSVDLPSKEPPLEKGGLSSVSARTLTEPDEATFEFDASLSSTVERKRSAPVKQIQPKGPLSPEMLDKMHRYWQAANYLTVGQIYLAENPLLREPLAPEHIKPRLLGHWGTSAGQNFIYVHLNRLINEHRASIISISGPGHGGPSMNAHSYLEGTYSEVHPEITRDANGMRLLFREFSTPGDPATAGRMCPTRSMKEANLATPCCMHLAPPSIILS